MEDIADINNNLIFLENILENKIEILKQILIISENQKMIAETLDKENLNSYLTNAFNEKQFLINTLKELDNKFIKIFEAFGGKLNRNIAFFKPNIKIIKEKIQYITELDSKRKLQEEKNKHMFQSECYKKPVTPLNSSKQYILKKYAQNTKKK